MSGINEKLEARPMARKESIIQGENYRITVLTESLLRLEYSRDGSFEDRATQTVLNRDFPVPVFKVSETEGELKIFTSALELTYNKQEFAPNGLFIKVTGGKSNETNWHYKDPVKDLGGTARTLDEADGAIPLESGVVSRNGFSIVDDSRSMAVTEDGWVDLRPEGSIDLYFFGYGHRYQEAVKDLYYLCGRTPLLPRWVFGNWWSRYHRYTEQEYKELMERFERERIPFSVAVVDMDWHLVDIDPKYGSGWTGYTWNREFFPDPKEFMDWLHSRNMKITLNVHPADGVRAYEEAYERVAKRMGIDPKSGEPVPFDVTDRHFLEVYFEELHHPLEDEGVDFWWLDWQQGTVTKIPGLDPLWMLNHFHYLDSARRGKRRLTFSRYAGIGSHRYPIGFSGDTVISWESLRFQPYFTATASNAGYGWWSHDIGGHMHGVRDDEMTARWVQLGVFSPLNRLHSTDNPFNGKEPWKYNKITQSVMEEFLRLRHKLVPYLYTMNRYASRDGQPLVRPMYWLEPEREETYHVPNEYYFGTELIAAPITDPADTCTCMGCAKAWLPKGTWFDFFNGRRYEGGRLFSVYRCVEEMPVFVRAGGIVPMQELPEQMNDLSNPQNLEICIFPGADGSFSLWEDEGDSPEDADENWVCTELTQKNGESFLISAAKGNISVLPERRTWTLCFKGVENAAAEVLADGQAMEAVQSYDADTRTLTVRAEEVPVTSEIKVRFIKGLMMAEKDMTGSVYEILERAQIAYDVKEAVLKTVEELGERAVPALFAMELEEPLLCAVTEVLTAC